MTDSRHGVMDLSGLVGRGFGHIPCWVAVLVCQNPGLGDGNIPGLETRILREGWGTDFGWPVGDGVLAERCGMYTCICSGTQFRSKEANHEKARGDDPVSIVDKPCASPETRMDQSRRPRQEPGILADREGRKAALHRGTDRRHG